MLRCSLCTLEPTLTTARDGGNGRTHLWLVRVASAWTLGGRAFCSPKYVAALSTWGLGFLRLSHSFRSTKDSAGLPTCENARSKYDSSQVMAILLSVTLWFYLKWPIWSSPQLKTVVTRCGWIGEYCDIWMESIHRLLCADVLWEIKSHMSWNCSHFLTAPVMQFWQRKSMWDGQDYDCWFFFLLCQQTSWTTQCFGEERLHNTSSQPRRETQDSVSVWPWPGGLVRFCTLSVGSGAAKTFEAILLGLLDAAASLSPPPKMLLDPPPGGRNTLGEDNNNVFNDLQRGL